MTPKEKAKELVFKYQNLVTIWDCYNDEPIEIKFRLEDMKKCALICVDEIIESESNYFPNEIHYWQEVKKEINKL
jgi:hypothetical protein